MKSAFIRNFNESSIVIGETAIDVLNKFCEAIDNNMMFHIDDHLQYAEKNLDELIDTYVNKNKKNYIYNFLDDYSRLLQKTEILFKELADKNLYGISE